MASRSVELRAIAQEIADALPATVEEVVLTGSVSRGVADPVSDLALPADADELDGRPPEGIRCVEPREVPRAIDHLELGEALG